MTLPCESKILKLNVLWVVMWLLTVDSFAQQNIFVKSFRLGFLQQSSKYILDTMGSIAYKNHFEAGLDHLQVDGASWPSGLYILCVLDIVGNVADFKK